MRYLLYINDVAKKIYVTCIYLRETNFEDE